MAEIVKEKTFPLDSEARLYLGQVKDEPMFIPCKIIGHVVHMTTPRKKALVSIPLLNIEKVVDFSDLEL